MYKNKILVLFIVIMTFWGCGKNEQEEVVNSNLKEIIHSTWIWDTNAIKDDILLESIQRNAIRKIYLQINTDIVQEEYKKFIAKANSNGVTVYALGGSPQWILEKEKYVAFFNWIAEYQKNSAKNERFTGVQCDVEPYVLDAWETDYSNVVAGYMRFIKDGEKAVSDIGIVFEVCIPFWFDGKTYSDEIFGSGNLAEFVVQNSDSVAVMAYRDVADGEDGIIKISQNEVEFAEICGKRITVAVETKNISPDKITFYEEGEIVMKEEIGKVESYFKRYDSFDTVGIHDYLNNFQ